MAKIRLVRRTRDPRPFPVPDLSSLVMVSAASPGLHTEYQGGYHLPNRLDVFVLYQLYKYIYAADIMHCHQTVPETTGNCPFISYLLLSPRTRMISFLKDVLS